MASSGGSRPGTSGSRPGTSGGGGYAADDPLAGMAEELAELEKAVKPTKITLQLAMKNSMTTAEFANYEKLSGDEVYEKVQRLKTLHLEWLQIGEIANLEPFEGAEVLYIQYNRIERIEGLDFMPKLQFLALQHNRIEVVENLRHLSELEFLDLSGNRISDLNVVELPDTLGVLNLKDNPITAPPGYLPIQSKLREHLPNLAYLDGVSLGVDDEIGGSLSSGAPSGGPADVQLAESGEKGLTAYYRKDELQLGLAANIEDQIQAYSTESLADCDGFSRRIEEAVKRSERRRDNVEEQLNAVKKAMATSDAHTAADAATAREAAAETLLQQEDAPPDA